MSKEYISQQGAGNHDGRAGDDEPKSWEDGNDEGNDEDEGDNGNGRDDED